MDAHISLIVPVYNVEQYLPRCLASIQAQTIFDQTEVHPGRRRFHRRKRPHLRRVCRAARQRPRSPQGKRRRILGAQRRAGRGHGRVHRLVDSDDFVEPECFARAYGAAVRTGADVVCFGFAASGATRR